MADEPAKRAYPSPESDDAFHAAGGGNIKSDRDFQLARLWFRAGYDTRSDELAAESGGSA